MGLIGNPYMQGALQGYMEQNEKTAEQQRADFDKGRQQLVDQFTRDVTAAKELLGKTKDPQQRQAVQALIQQLQQAYSGTAAAKYGLDQSFKKQIEFAMQEPYNIKESEYNPNSGSGSSQFERLVASGDLKPEEAQKLIRERAETMARGGMDPIQSSFDKKAGTGLGEDYADIQKRVAGIGQALADLELVENASKEALTGPVMGKFTPNLSTAAQQLDAQSTKDALKFVNDTKGAVSDREMSMFKAASIGTDKTPEFNQTMINIAKAILVRQAQQAEFFKAWREVNGTTEGAYNAFKKYADENKLFDINGTKAVLRKNLDDLANDRSWENYIVQEVPSDIQAAVDASPAGKSVGGTGGPDSPMPPPVSGGVKFLGFE